MKSPVSLSAILAAVLLTAGCAASQQTAALAPDAVLRTLRTKFPAVPVEEVKPSADVPGWYEVITRDEIVYTDSDASRLFIGKVIDVGSQTDLTEKRWNALNRIDFSALPFDQALKVVKGNGARKLAVFSDPFCPYCQELETSLQSVNDVTVYVFLYPLEGVHPGATAAALDIWCAQDREAAWSQWMLQRHAPAESKCEQSPLESLSALGQRLRINSTPTIFTADGERIPGAISPEQIEQRLAATALSH